jgi:hypothetical protein
MTKGLTMNRRMTIQALFDIVDIEFGDHAA